MSDDLRDRARDLLQNWTKELQKIYPDAKVSFTISEGRLTEPFVSVLFHWNLIKYMDATKKTKKERCLPPFPDFDIPIYGFFGRFYFEEETVPGEVCHEPIVYSEEEKS
jgi:hypothetical protein